MKAKLIGLFFFSRDNTISQEVKVDEEEHKKQCQLLALIVLEKERMIKVLEKKYKDLLDILNARGDMPD